MSAGALAGPASRSQLDGEVPDAHHDPVRCPCPGSAGVHEYRAAGAGRIPRGIQRPDPSPGRFIVLGQRAGPAIAQVNDCGSPTARPQGQTTSPGPSCSAGWTSCRCRRGAPPPAWPPSGSPPCPRLSFALRARWAQASTRRSLKPPGPGGAVFPGLPVAALCATLAVQGGNRGRARRPSGIPSARRLRTFGSFRVGRAAATMMA